jgi:pyridoxamine 5'-phosphate oxidase
LFFWPELERQIRIEGKTKKLAEHLSDQYFDSRPDSSKIGAWASQQSTKIPDRKYLEKQKADFEKKFRNQKVQRPDYWGGYLVIPYRYEFWQGRENRLHDRIEYQKENNNWKINRLAP